jgi:hypothetical protein
MKVAGIFPGHFCLAIRGSIHSSSRTSERKRAPIRDPYSEDSLLRQAGNSACPELKPVVMGPRFREDDEIESASLPQSLSLSSLRIGEPSPIESKPVSE